MNARYKLIPEEIPAISKSTVYENILDEFLKSKSKSVRVEVVKKKPSTVHQGLLKMKRSNASFATVFVVRRGDSIYLKK